MGITALPCFIAGKLVYPDGENNAANNSVDSSIDKSILTLDGQESIAVASTSAVTDAGGGRLYLGNLNGAYVSVVDVTAAGGGGEGGEEVGKRDEL